MFKNLGEKIKKKIKRLATLGNGLMKLHTKFQINRSNRTATRRDWVTALEMDEREQGKILGHFDKSIKSEPNGISTSGKRLRGRENRGPSENAHTKLNPFPLGLWDLAKSRTKRAQ